MAAGEILPGEVNYQLHMTPALKDVAAWEGGAVLNDRYTEDRYVRQRAHYLGRHPDYKHLTCLFPSVRGEAANIFQQEDEELSVQEVRRREIARDILPLLPFPTTQNTQTIDNFQSYPQTEWKSGMVWLATQLAANHQRLPGLQQPPRNRFPTEVAIPRRLGHSNPSSQHVGATYGHFPGQSTSHRYASINNDSRLITTTNPTLRPFSSAVVNNNAVTVPAMGQSNSKLKRLIMQSANTTKAAPLEEQTGRKNRSHHQPLQDFAEPISNAMFTPIPYSAPEMMATPTHHADGGYAMPNDELAEPDPITMRNILDHLGTPVSGWPVSAQRDGDNHQVKNTSSRPDRVMVDERISALKGHGINVPVKSQTKSKRRTKRDGTPSTEVSEQDDIGPPAEASPRPSTIVKLRVHPQKLAEMTVGSKRAQPDPNPHDASPKKSKRVHPEHEDEEPPPKRQKKVTIKSRPNHLEEVIAGTALPKTPREAKNAAQSRFDRLLQDHKNKNKQLRQTRKAVTTPDFTPEFFNKDNFPRGQEEDSVRCICGAVTDDKKPMIACDDCSVWQHNMCMGDAVPKDAEKAKYLCQVCDPWAHRGLLVKLRREHPLTEGAS